MSINLTSLPKIKDSTTDSQINYKLVATFVFFVALGGVGLWSFLHTGTILKSIAPEQITPTATVTLTPLFVAVPPTEAPTPTPTPLPPLPLLLPTIPPLPTPTPLVEVQVVYIDRIVERVVTEQLEAPALTPTAVLPVGVVRICVYLEGATGLYINDEGKPGNSCFDYSASSSVNDYNLKVTR